MPVMHRIALIISTIVLGTVGIEAGQDPVAYCTDLFPDSYRMREFCLEQEREAAARLAASGDTAQPRADTVQARAVIKAEVVAANLARFDNALVSEVDFGSIEAGELHSRVVARMPEGDFIRCVPSGDDDVRSCAWFEGNVATARWLIRAAE